VIIRSKYALFNSRNTCWTRYELRTLKQIQFLLFFQFPSIQAVNNAGLFGFRVILPPICQPPDISAALLFANDESRPQLDIASLNGPMAEHVRQVLSSFLHQFYFIIQLEHIHLADVRRWDRGPWDHCRPRHWPAFHQLRSSENWKVYELRREGLLRNRSRQQAQKRQRLILLELYSNRILKIIGNPLVSTIMNCLLTMALNPFIGSWLWSKHFMLVQLY
jgi:hypothetical protein